MFQISPRIFPALIFGEYFAKKPSTFLPRYFSSTIPSDEFERSSRCSNDFHETFVNMFGGSVKNDVALEKDSQILKAMNTGKF